MDWSTMFLYLVFFLVLLHMAFFQELLLPHLSFPNNMSTSLAGRSSRRLISTLPEFSNSTLQERKSEAEDYRTTLSPLAPSSVVVERAPGSSGKKKKAILLAGIVVAILVAFIYGTVCLFLMRRRSRASNPKGEEREKDNLDRDEEEAFAQIKGGLQRFPFKQLVKATRNFHVKRRLGGGGSATVYRGFLRDLNADVAIKRIWREDIEQAKKEFKAELEVINQLRHRHLLQILGWCYEKGEFLLVYELMPNLSLDRHLFGGDRLLPWHVRYKISLQVASALLYLHQGWNECIIHRDIKSSNVLLDDAFDAKLGDFGIARLTKHGAGLQSTALCGTVGYMAPECFQTGKASKESDVYAFGIVALELATGRRVVDSNAEEGEVPLLKWVWALFEKGETLAAADRRLEGNYDRGQMERLLKVGLWCAHPIAHHRPTIETALASLNFEDVKMDLPLEMPVAKLTFATQTTSSYSGGQGSGKF